MYVGIMKVVNSNGVC